jgi:hypothetical protein
MRQVEGVLEPRPRLRISAHHLACSTAAIKKRVNERVNKRVKKRVEKSVKKRVELSVNKSVKKSVQHPQNQSLLCMTCIVIPLACLQPETNH